MFLKGDFESALRHYQRALEMAPDQTGLPGDIAMTLLNLKRYPQAERWFRRALPFRADRESRWTAGLGVALFVQGRSVEATPYLEQALALDPNQAMAHEALAILRARAGRDAEAEHHFRAAVRLEPDHEPYRENLEKFLKHRASPR
jgi:Flp pilus assembly protein TadD